MKRYSNKIKLILFIVLGFISCSSPEIFYKPRGMTDKGLPEIHMGKTCKVDYLKNYNLFDPENSSDTIVQIYLNTPNPWTRCYELDRKSLKNLKNYIMMQKGVSTDSNSLRKYPDWGSYGVIVNHKGKSIYLFLRGYEESRIFFYNQLHFFNKKEALFNEIEALSR